MTAKLWSEEFRPQKILDVLGNPKAVNALMGWIGGWKEGKVSKNAVLLYGPTGTGKTSAAYSLANELNFDRIELNASDTRTKDVINRIVGSASSSGTLDIEKKRKIIIVDEVDGIHGRKDYGGLSALKNAIKKTRQPIILMANDPWSLPQDFRRLCLIVEFRKINQRTVLKTLKSICRRKGIEADERALKIIATNANGDLRSAINDLQALSVGNPDLKFSDIEILTLRDSETKIFHTIAQILKTNSCDRAREAMWDSNEQPETILNWIVENVPIEYTDPEDLARAFNYISRADVFMGRIIRRQSWGLLSYASDLMSVGVATSKKQKYHGFSKYQYPSTFALMARTRKERNLSNAISKKVSNVCHVSGKVAKAEFLPMLDIVLNNDPYMGARISSELELGLEEIESFVDDEKQAKHIYNASEDIRKEKLKASLHKDAVKQVSLSEF
ncbi:MAG: replication factor C large subunit [Candidatus Hydrothermarchaeales archaeon]